MNRRSIFWVLTICTIFFPVGVLAARFDLMIQPDITFLSSKPMVFQDMKLYVTIDNNGADDVEGMVIFKDGAEIIGQKPISVRAAGKSEEVWLSWTPKTEGLHNIQVQVVNDLEFQEATPANNQVTETIFVDADTDGDSIPNSTDPDIDNDGLSNTQEQALGTNPIKKDTDGDNVNDASDAFPLDPAKSEKPAPPPAPIPAPVQKAPAPSSQTIKSNQAQGTQTQTVTNPASPSIAGSQTKLSQLSGSSATKTESVAEMNDLGLEVDMEASTNPTNQDEQIAPDGASQGSEKQNGNSDNPSETTSNTTLDASSSSQEPSDTTSILLWIIALILALLTTGAFYLSWKKSREF